MDEELKYILYHQHKLYFTKTWRKGQGEDIEAERKSIERHREREQKSERNKGRRKRGKR